MVAHAATRRIPETEKQGAFPLPEYAQATALYRVGDRKGALAKIERLLSDPHLTSERRAFLQRQKAICEGKLPVSAPPSVGNTPAEPKGDCGPKALVIVLKRMGISANSEELGKLAGTNRYGTTLEGLAQAANAKGLTATGVQMDGTALKRYEGMAVAWADGDHYLAVLKVEGEKATIQDPNATREEVIETDTLLRRSGGILLTLQRSNSHAFQTK